MSGPSLPEDVSRWPEDPFELLGVRPGIAPRELRKVYTGLIRTYKPEQFPEQFRRIRAAYEFVLRHLELFKHFHIVEEREDEDAPRTPEQSECEELPPPRPVEPDDEAMTEKPERLHTPLPDAPCVDLYRQLHDAWELACTNQEAEAYEQLRRLQEAHREEVEVYLRLYWLLALMPELDRGRGPADWLFAGIRAAGLSGQLRELLRREIAEFPGLALRDELLHSTSNLSALLDLLEWRWQAARQRSQWTVISDDVARLHERFLREDEEAWARLLLLAIDHFAWAHGDSYRARVAGWVKELEQSIHLHGRLSSEMDRLDFLLALSQAWRGSTQLPNHPSFHALIRDSWTRPPGDLRATVQEYLALVVQDPPRFLGYFDSLVASASPVLTQYGKLLLDYAAHSGREVPEEECSTAAGPRVLEALDDLESDQYRWIRPQLLRICLSEAVSPEAVANLVVGKPTYWMSGQMHLSQGLAQDWPMRYVFLSCWLFWQ